MGSSGNRHQGRVRVKVCGLTRPEDARAAAVAGADALGLNFVRESPRFIGGLRRARALIRRARVAGAVQWAGVFVNPRLRDVLRVAEVLGLRIIQLHGDETPAFCLRLKQRLAANVVVWKAFRVAREEDLAALPHYPCDAWLVDAFVSRARGGTGRTFDWEILKGIKRSKSLVLAGGLHPGNVGEAVRRVRPDWVDVASGVETAPGVKDPARVAQFVRAARTSLA